MPLLKKGDPLDPNNYRTIWLLDVAGKILAKVINRRLTYVAETFLPDSQNGFRPGRSTAQSILQLRLIQQSGHERNVPVIVCFIDLRKAFDSLPRKLILDILTWLGVPPALLRLIEALHSDVVGKVLCCGRPHPFVAHRGVRQGCCLGPMIFNLVNQVLLNKADLGSVAGLGVTLENKPELDQVRVPGDDAGATFIHTLSFADDVALVAHTPEAITRAVDRLRNVFERFGLKLHPVKTVVMWLSGRPRRPRPAYMGTEEIATVSEFAYLGSTFHDPSQTKGGLTCKDVGTALGRGKKALACLRPFFRKRSVPLKLKVRLAKSCVVPALLYGSEGWRIDAEIVRRMDSFLNTVRLACLNRPWITQHRKLSAMGLRRRCMYDSFRSLVASRRVSFVVCTAVLRNCEATTRMLTASFSDRKGKRQGGRASTRYLRTVSD